MASVRLLGEVIIFVRSRQRRIAVNVSSKLQGWPSNQKAERRWTQRGKGGYKVQPIRGRPLPCDVRLGMHEPLQSAQHSQDSTRCMVMHILTGPA